MNAKIVLLQRVTRKAIRPISSHHGFILFAIGLGQIEGGLPQRLRDQKDLDRFRASQLVVPFAKTSGASSVARKLRSGSQGHIPECQLKIVKHQRYHLARSRLSLPYCFDTLVHDDKLPICNVGIGTCDGRKPYSP